MRSRRPTATSNFGVGRREAHDATAFYARFAPPEISGDATVAVTPPIPDPFICGDARTMDELEDGSVALVVTSPPYFAGKTYEEELDRDGVPRSYLEYLELLGAVFSECKTKLEPGGRIAVNVANLGRKPYRSLSADVIRILQDDLGLLLRGEVIWQKGEGASGSCAWGSFRRAANPVLRDLTERVIIASKGRFDRALNARERAAAGLPHESSLSSDEFMAATLDVWDIAPESARRVQHPAPFPEELPERLIRLFTYEGDLVLDPFMGSGSTLVAAARLRRRYVGYDLDGGYVEIARARVAAAEPAGDAVAPTGRISGPPDGGYQEEATQAGGAANAIAERVLEEAGFSVTGRNVKLRGLGLAVSFVAADRAGDPWYFDTSGAFTTTRAGLSRTETVWRALGRAHVLASNGMAPLILLTSHLPTPGSDADAALRAAKGGTFFDATEILSPSGRSRLAAYASATQPSPLAGFWTDEEVAALAAVRR